MACTTKLSADFQGYQEVLEPTLEALIARTTRPETPLLESNPDLFSWQRVSNPLPVPRPEVTELALDRAGAFARPG